MKTDDNGEVVGWKWTRKHSSAANHFFDVAVYNLAVRDIVADAVCKEAGLKIIGWAAFVDLLRNIGK